MRAHSLSLRLSVTFESALCGGAQPQPASESDIESALHGGAQPRPESETQIESITVSSLSLKSRE